MKTIVHNESHDEFVKRKQLEAKKEVFDDLYFGENKTLLVVGETPCLQHFYNGGIDMMKKEVVVEALRKFLKYFFECKQRHLSTFQNKRDIGKNV